MRTLAPETHTYRCLPWVMRVVVVVVVVVYGCGGGGGGGEAREGKGREDGGQPGAACLPACLPDFVNTLGAMRHAVLWL